MKYSLLPSVFNRLEIRLPFPRRTFRPFGGISFLFTFPPENPDSCYRIYLSKYPDSHIISYRILFCRHSPYRYRLGGGHHSTYDVSYSL